MIKKTGYYIFGMAIIVVLICQLCVMLYKGKMQIHYTACDEQSLENPAFLNPLMNFSQQKKVIVEEMNPFQSELDAYIQRLDPKQFHVAVYFRDLTNGMWFGINERDEFYPASLFKVPIMLLWLKAIDDKKITFDTKLKYQVGMTKLQNTTPTTLTNGNEYSVRSLIEEMIVHSDNEASLLLFHSADQKEIRDLFQKLQIDFSESKPVTVSAKSYSVAFRILYNASFLSPDLSNWALHLLTRADYTGGIRSAVPISVPVAHKFGFNFVKNTQGKTDFYLHHTAIVYNPLKPFLFTVMSKGVDKDSLEKIISDLTKITLRNVQSHTTLNF